MNLFDKGTGFEFSEVELTSLMEETLSQTRTNVVLGSAIFAYLLMKAKFVFVESNDIQTMHTVTSGNEHAAYINAGYFFGFPNDKQRAAVIMHCLKHIFFMHQHRCIENGYNHDMFEAASDFYVNLAIAGAYNKNGLRFCSRYQKYFELPSDWLYDTRFVGMSVDEIYEILEKESEEDQSTPQSPDSLGGDGGTDRMQVGLIKSMTEAVISAQQSNRIGESEGNIEAMIAEMSKPVVQWTDILASKIMSSVKQRETYNRISRRSSGDGDGVIFPSYTGNKIRVVFGFDCSGSMGNMDYKRVVGELYGLLEQFESWDVYVVSCDTKLTEIGYYSSEDMDTFDDVKLVFKGLGGTDMAPIPEYANSLVNEYGQHIDACIVVTDGYIQPHTLDATFDDMMLNVVVTTQQEVNLNNAECIHAGQ